MILAYNKLSFSQVYKLHTSLHRYYHSDKAKTLPKPENEEAEMDLCNSDEEGEEVDEGGKMSKEDLDFAIG